MAAIQLLDAAQPVFQKAVENASWGDDITWAVTWGQVQTEQGPHTVYIVYLHCSALHALGEYLQRVFPVPISAKPDAISRIIADQVEGLRTDRARALAQASSNGNAIILS